MMDRETPGDIWNSWVGADYPPAQAVAEAQERGLPLSEMAAELVICAAEAHGVALTDTHDPDVLAAAFLRLLERTAGHMGHVADDARQDAQAEQMRTPDGRFLEPQEPPF
jgi:hypothetical protein